MVLSRGLLRSEYPRRAPRPTYCFDFQGGADGAVMLCTPRDPYAELDLKSRRNSSLSRSIPRIRFCLNPGPPSQRYRRVIRRIGPDGRIIYDYIPDDAGVFKADGTYAGQQGLNLAHRHFEGKGPQTDDETDAVPKILVKQTSMGRMEFEAHKSNLDGHLGHVQSPLYSSLAPVDQEQLCNRSTDRIKALQATLGGEALAERHGKAPPKLAPFYQSGANYCAEEVQG